MKINMRNVRVILKGRAKTSGFIEKMCYIVILDPIAEIEACKVGFVEVGD